MYSQTHTKCTRESKIYMYISCFHDRLMSRKGPRREPCWGPCGLSAGSLPCTALTFWIGYCTDKKSWFAYCTDKILWFACCTAITSWFTYCTAKTSWFAHCTAEISWFAYCTALRFWFAHCTAKRSWFAYYTVIRSYYKRNIIWGVFSLLKKHHWSSIELRIKL